MKAFVERLRRNPSIAWMRTSPVLDVSRDGAGRDRVRFAIRGFTADLLVMDEAAFIPFIPDLVYAAARPMLAASGGDLVAMSSAHEPVGFFLGDHDARAWRELVADDSASGGTNDGGWRLRDQCRIGGSARV